MNMEFLKKCWKHPRWHSLMVLLIWIVALALLMGVVSLANGLSGKKEQSKPNTKENEEMIYLEKWDLFKTNVYEFTYTITKPEETIKYNGTYKDGIVSGYRERKDGIIKYSIEEDITYENILNEKIAIDTLYENVEASFLNPISIYETIQNVREENIDILEERENTTYTYTLEDTKIEIVTDAKKITKITITNKTDVYVLDFDYIS